MDFSLKIEKQTSIMIIWEKFVMLEALTTQEVKLDLFEHL
jgi:hypothetical protein